MVMSHAPAHAGALTDRLLLLLLLLLLPTAVLSSTLTTH
jgi:hypothetical protein